MLSIWKYIKRFWCKHDIVYVRLYVKKKYKKTKRGYKFRYDVWEKRKCYDCGKTLPKFRIKFDLNGEQLRKYLSEFDDI